MGLSIRGMNLAGAHMHSDTSYVGGGIKVSPLKTKDIGSQFTLSPPFFAIRFAFPALNLNYGFDGRTGVDASFTL
jgi:hypothetical protein